MYSIKLILNRKKCTICHKCRCSTRANPIPISKGGTDSSRMHNLAKAQSYQGLKLISSDTKCMMTVTFMFIYHRFQEN